MPPPSTTGQRPPKRAQRASGPTRLAIVVGGWSLIIASPVIAPLPGPGGVAAALAGLVLVLRHSPGSRRTFVRMSRRHPRFVMPLRRMLKDGLPTDGGLTGLPGRTASRLKGWWRQRGQPN